MNVRRHRRDTATYRELRNYKERVQAFNAAVMKLPEYVRVQLDMDADDDAPTQRRIVEARLRTLEKYVNRIRTMARGL